MGKPSRFEIYFSPPEKQIFRPGETVEGFVELVLEKEQKFNNLAIEFYGRAEVHWISDSSKEHTAISSEEQYFHEAVEPDYISKHENNVLPAGSHSIPFQFRLPENIPSSFDGAHGHIHYAVKANLQRAWEWKSPTLTPFLHVKKQIMVVGNVDPIEQKMAHEPIHLHKKQEISGSFYRKDQKGYLDVDITIPKWAFCSGELVPLKGTIDNQSGGTVHLKTILEQQCLYKGVQFMGGPEEKMHTVEVMIWEHPESIPAHTKFELENVTIPIPHEAAPELFGCNIMVLGYKLKIEVGRMFHGHVSLEHPLFIGAIKSHFD